MAYRHVVLFLVHDHVAEERVDEAVAALRSLGDLPGVLTWTVHRSDDVRKGRVLLENALLDGPDRVQELRAHPRHDAVVAIMRDIADWWVADHPEP